MKYSYKTAGFFSKITDATTAAIGVAPEVGAKATTMSEVVRNMWQNPTVRLTFLTGVLSPMIAEGVEAFIGKMSSVIKDKMAEVKKKEYYKKMLEAHPALMNEDPEKVGMLWASLYHHAPAHAQDPIAAGAFIRQTIQRGMMEESGGPAPDTYKLLTDINKNLMDSSKRQTPVLSDKMREALSERLNTALVENTDPALAYLAEIAQNPELLKKELSPYEKGQLDLGFAKYKKYTGLK